ncbi:MAG: TetR/AcrR family transcriptional regulator [bacterium]
MDKHIRQRIVKKAAELFPRLGFSKVTMDELCDELGISKKTLYKYFTSKDEIADAVYQRNMKTIKNDFRKIIHGKEAYLKRLYKLCEFISEFLSRMTKTAQQDLMKHRPDIWEKIETYRKQEIFPIFNKMFDEGIKLGFVRQDVQKELLFLIFTSMVEGVITPRTLIEQSFSMKDAFMGIITVFFNGVLTDKARVYYNKRFLKD